MFPKMQIPPAGKICVTLQNGKRVMLYTNQTSHVSHVIFWQGLYAYEYIRLFEEIIVKCQGFVDIGSNTGIYSLIAATVNNQIQIIAFDPTDAAQFYLRKNIQVNNFTDRIKPFQLAVSNSESTLGFYQVRNPKYPFLKYNLGGTSGFINKPDFYSEKMVQTVQADSFLQNHFPNLQIDFIKIDAEGAEPEILDGLQKTISQWKPIIVCEIRFEEKTHPLTKFFENYRYTAFLFHKNKLWQSSTFQNSDIPATDCFFVPQEKYYLVEKFIAAEVPAN